MRKTNTQKKNETTEKTTMQRGERCVPWDELVVRGVLEGYLICACRNRIFTQHTTSDVMKGWPQPLGTLKYGRTCIECESCN